MNHLHTFSSQINRICLRVWLILLCVGIVGADTVHGQYTTVYAKYLTSADTSGTNGGGGTAGTLGSAGAVGTHSIINPTNANDLNFSDYVELRGQSGAAGTGVGGGAGAASSSYIKLNFSGAVTPVTGTPIIIKLQAVNNSLLSAINPLTQVSIQAYNGASTVGSAVLVSTLSLRNTDEYIFTPTGSCNAIRITATTAGSNILGAASTTSAYVYYAYMFDPACSPPYTTAKSITGILGAGDVTNPYDAIDGNISSYSAFGMVLGLGATLHQDVYFSNLSATTDAATVTLAVPASLVSVGLLGSTSITAYNNTTSVGSVTFSALLAGTDLLTLLQSGAATTISFAPGVAFNRIEVAMSSLASVATSLNLYEVQRTPPKPSFTLPKNDTVYVCNGSTAALTANSPGAGNELRWYASALPSNTTVLHTGDTFTVPFAITCDTLFYVATGKTGCTPSSERVPVRILMKPLPGITFNSNIYTCQHSSNALLVYTTPVNSPSQYNITWGAAAITANFQHVPVTAFPVSPLNIAVPVTAAPNAYSGTLILTATNSCTRSYNFTLTIQASPHPPPPVTSFQ